MEQLILGTHTIYVQPPVQGPCPEGLPAVFLNDGELLAHLPLCAERAVLFGVVPNDRLREYTPWAEKAIRPGAPDFGGGLAQYHQQLLTEILPPLEREYRLDSTRLAYGGFSLGGLAAAMSLWETDRFRFVFSLCGSFWYPGVLDFIEGHPPLNRRARVLLLNGTQEGKDHNNLLHSAAPCARQAHRLLASQVNVTSVMDDYAHHDQKAERFRLAMRWLDQQFGA